VQSRCQVQVQSGPNAVHHFWAHSRTQNRTSGSVQAPCRTLDRTLVQFTKVQVRTEVQNRTAASLLMRLDYGHSIVVSINSSLVLLIEDAENRLEVCKLELGPGPQLQTLCFLELPPLAPGAVHYMLGPRKDWVPTSKSYTWTRSSRGYHLPFYTSRIGTIVIDFQYRLQLGQLYQYALMISVAALIASIPTDVCNVPWEDWGPSSTHFFKMATERLTSVGPFWITECPSLVLRQYDI
jgi:hypothetical protein